MTPDQLLAALLYLLMLAGLGISILGFGGTWIFGAVKRRALPERSSLLVGAIIVGVFALGAVGAGWLQLRLSPFHRAPFQQQRWLEARTDRDSLRGRMAGSLVRRHLKKGMKREAVVRLLGPPDGREQYRGRPLVEGRGYERTREILRYYLGDWSGMRLDGDYLDIAIDGSGQLIGAWIWQS